MKKKINSDKPIGKVERLEDFLPSPAELMNSKTVVKMDNPSTNLRPIQNDFSVSIPKSKIINHSIEQHK